MKKIQALIVDDEPLAREFVRKLLKDDMHISIVGECGDGVEAIEAIRGMKPDLVFLDIQMPEKDGFDVIQEIGANEMPVIVFITAYDEYALRAFDVYALDYLLKPFDKNRFEQTISRAKAIITGSRQSELHQRLESWLEERNTPSKYLRRIAVRSRDSIQLIKTSQIDWLESEGNYVRLHAGSSSFLLRQTLYSLEKELDPNLFSRIHRRTIVNLDRIAQLRQMFHGELQVLLTDGTELKMSRSYRHKVPKIADKS